MVSCIVTHHINQNDWLLTRCIRSLIADQCPKEIIIVTDAPFPPTLILAEPCAYLKIFHFTDGSMNHSVKKGNFGASKASPSSQAFFFMGDDVVVLPDSVGNLAEEACYHNMILNPLSNCDDINIINPQIAGFLREVDPLKEEGGLHHLADITKQLPFIFPTNRLYFFATMIPRAVWEKVGSFDEQFESGFDDSDYCLRAAISNIRLGVLSNAFVLHYGHQTIAKLPTESAEVSQNNYRKFQRKYGVVHIPGLAMPGYGSLELAGLQAIEQLRALQRK